MAMPTCRDLEPLVTAWIDGVATDGDRRAVEGHLGACGACRARADAEGAVRALIRGHAAGALRAEAPAWLRARCRVVPFAPDVTAAPVTRATALRLPLAAALAFGLTVLLIYGLTVASPTTLVAQLVLDHVKCFVITREPRTPVRPELVEARLSERYGWKLDVPGDSDGRGLRLVGSRRCLDGEGTIAHVLYRYNGAPLSLFMLPERVRPAEIVDVLGYEAIMWPGEHRTFVLLGSGPREELERIGVYIREMVK